MKHTLVSVIVPTKDSEEFLEGCLRSIKAQSYKNIETIVIDNYSTDSTQKIAKQYADKFLRKGPERSAQRNYGVSKANGNYVAIIDSDMELTRDVIKECVEAIKYNSKAVIIPEESFGEGFWAQCKRLERSFYIGVDWLEAARFYDKKFYEALGGFNENMVSGEDWDLSLRAAKLTRILRVNGLILHNEGSLKLRTTLKKKYYYSKQFGNYAKTNKSNGVLKLQTGLLYRYKLFFSKPTKLFKNPLFGLGMLYMKTCEFALGAAGYLATRLRNV